MPCIPGTFKMVCREPRGPADLEYSNISLKLLEILCNLAFVSTRFGYASFDEWNFVYLASIDLLCASPAQAVVFVNAQLPGTFSLPVRLKSDIQSRHPAAKVDALFFLDTLEQ